MSRDAFGLGERFWARVHKTDGCWEWTGCRQADGYGRVYGGRGASPQIAAAHRFAYALTHGPIPTGLCVCHKCDNPPCCNPAHLFLGTVRDNAKDMAGKGRAAPQKYPEHYPKRPLDVSAPGRAHGTPACGPQATHCRKGHELTPENLMPKESPKRCRMCFRLRMARHHDKYRGVPQYLTPPIETKPDTSAVVRAEI